MYQHVPGTSRAALARPTIRPLTATMLAAFAAAFLALFAVAAPAPAQAATVPTQAADLCAQTAARASFSGGSLTTAVAVAMAESACNPAAYHINGPTTGCPNGSTDRGLWQINSCWHPTVSKTCAYDPQCNANAAYRISARGTNFKRWVTYSNGAYRSYLAQAQAAVARLS
jgi:lysozyme-like protein